MTAQTQLSVRTPRWNYEKLENRFWFRGNPHLSHLIHALSFLFPPGEETFVRSVQRFRGAISEPCLSADIDAFIAQESLHGAQHRRLNLWLSQRIPEAEQYCEAIAASIRADFKRVDQRFPKLNLAITVAFEHMTAIAATALLERPEIVDSIEEPLRSLLIWHAIEEIEHRSVAFDVYQTVSGSYPLRMLAMVFACIMLVSQTLRYQMKLLARDGQLGNWRSLREALHLTCGPNGYFRALLKPFLSYGRASFHPSQACQSVSIEAWQRRMQELD